MTPAGQMQTEVEVQEMQVEVEQPKLPSTYRLTNEHLQLIFEMRWDIADQLHSQTMLSRQLDALFDTLSGKPDSRRCPSCHQPLMLASVWPHPPPNGGNSGT
jgi:hypothetical protein